jgi:hypothetical protein
MTEIEPPSISGPGGSGDDRSPRSAAPNDSPEERIGPPSDSLDAIEQEYMRAINRARTSDEAFELSIGLRQYRELYKDTANG